MGETQEETTVVSADCSCTVGQEPRGDRRAFLLAFALQQTLIVEKANSRQKAKHYAYHMKEHLYCNTTKKDGNQLKEASVGSCKTFGRLASLFIVPRALPE